MFILRTSVHFYINFVNLAIQRFQNVKAEKLKIIWLFTFKVRQGYITSEYGFTKPRGNRKKKWYSAVVVIFSHPMESSLGTCPGRPLSSDKKVDILVRLCHHAKARGQSLANHKVIETGWGSHGSLYFNPNFVMKQTLQVFNTFFFFFLSFVFLEPH